MSPLFSSAARGPSRRPQSVPVAEQSEAYGNREQSGGQPRSASDAKTTLFASESESRAGRAGERHQESYARRAQLRVTIGGHDATSALTPSLLEFAFTDHAGGKADEVQLTLHDREGHWNIDWKPKKGMAVSAAILVRDWFGPGQDASLPCGAFRIDEVEFTGPPDKVRIKAVSSALTTGLRDEARTKAWETYSLKGLAGEIAAAHGLELIYQGEEHTFGRQDQRRESDLAFLNRLATGRSMRCKVHDGKLILYDGPAAEGKKAAIVIPKNGSPLSPARYSFRQSSSGTGYQMAQVAYTDPSQGITHVATVAAEAATTVAHAASAPRDHKTLQLDARVESAAEAMRLGKSALHNANAKADPATLELMGHPGIVAGVTLALTGFGDFSGTYFVNKAEHKVAGSGGYTTSVELQKSQITGRNHA